MNNQQEQVREIISEKFIKIEAQLFPRSAPVMKEYFNKLPINAQYPNYILTNKTKSSENMAEDCFYECVPVFIKQVLVETNMMEEGSASVVNVDNFLSLEAFDESPEIVQLTKEILLQIHSDLDHFVHFLLRRFPLHSSSIFPTVVPEAIHRFIRGCLKHLLMLLFLLPTKSKRMMDETSMRTAVVRKVCNLFNTMMIDDVFIFCFLLYVCLMF